MKGRLLLRAVVLVALLATAVWGGAWLILSTPIGQVLGLTDSTITKQLAWTPPVGTEPGDHEFVITATDDKGAQSTQTVTVTVATPEPSSEPPATSIAISPSEGAYEVGATFTMSLALQNPTEPVSAVMVDLSFTDAVSYAGFNDDTSVFERPIQLASRAPGQLQIARATLNEPFSGASGNIIDLTFRTVRSGSATVTIERATSSVIAADTFADVLDEVAGASASVSGDDAYICFTLALQERAEDESQAAPVQVEVRNAENESIRSFDATSGSDGVVYIRDGRLIRRLRDNPPPYSVTITPLGHLPLELTGIQNLFDPGCPSLGTATWGDVAGPAGVLDDADLVRIVRYFTGNYDKNLTALFPNYSLELSDIALFIANMRTQPAATPTPSPTPAPTLTPPSPTDTPTPEETPLTSPSEVPRVEPTATP